MKKKILLDTHVFIEIRSGSTKLPHRVKKIFHNPDSELYISIASVWEMAIKMHLKKLHLDLPLKELMQSALSTGLITLLPMELEHVFALQTLSDHHRDPFDRILISQSKHENMALLSGDEVFDLYKIERIW